MLGYDYHPAAEAEYLEAIDRYARVSPELGTRFVSHVEAAIQRAREFPEAYGLIAAGLRHIVTRKFPYVIL